MFGDATQNMNLCTLIAQVLWERLIEQPAGEMDDSNQCDQDVFLGINGQSRQRLASMVILGINGQSRLCRFGLF
jgi:hypothetical protein